MGCSSCGGGGSSTQAYQYAAIHQHNTPQMAYDAANCTYTNAILEKWKLILTCIKIQSLGSLVGIETFQMNVLMGVIQSALNYPNNYCFYKQQLDDFQTNILPRIIENVPDCTN